jgi:4-hydroxythreonine-4-phosphate dehydrogenase
MPLLLTPGDPAGIGPEITLAALSGSPVKMPVVCIGAREPFDRLGARVHEVVDLSGVKRAPPGEILLMRAPEKRPGVRLGRAALEGFQAGWSIERAARLVLEAAGSALVTGPIDKAKLNAGGYAYPGHTEMLARVCAGGSARPLPVTMMLANAKLRVSLVTTHVALARVPRVLRVPEIVRAASHTIESLVRNHGIARPRVAVCGLNPHAGEGGLFGTEESRVIEPAVRSLRRRYSGRADVVGPLPSDTLFATHLLAAPGRRFDAVVCMYHDQGLIPVKLVDFYGTVNISLGLPIIRTSVDHGVAYDLVGTGRAKPDSLIAALRIAESMLQNRKWEGKRNL